MARPKLSASKRKKSISVTIAPAVLKEARKRANNEGVSLSEHIEKRLIFPSIQIP